MHLRKKLTHFLNLEAIFKRDALMYIIDSKVHTFRQYYNYIVCMAMIIVGIKYFVLSGLAGTKLATNLGSFGVGPMVTQAVIHIGHGVSALFVWRDNSKLSRSFLNIYKTKNATLIEELDVYAKAYLLRSRITYHFINTLFSTFVFFGWGFTIVAPMWTVEDTNVRIKYTIPSCLTSAFAWYYVIRHAVYFHFLVADVPIFVQARLNKFHHDLTCLSKNEQVNRSKHLSQILKKFVKVYEEAHRDNQLISRSFGCIYLFGYILISIIIYLTFSTHSETDRVDYIIAFVVFVVLTMCIPTFSARAVDKPQADIKKLVLTMIQKPIKANLKLKLLQILELIDQKPIHFTCFDFFALCSRNLLKTGLEISANLLLIIISMQYLSASKKEYIVA